MALGVLRGKMRNETVCKAREIIFKRKINCCYLPNPISGVLQEEKYPLQYQNRCFMVSGLFSQKTTLIAIPNIHFHLQYTLFQNGRYFSILLFTCKLALVASFKGKHVFEFRVLRTMQLG